MKSYSVFWTLTAQQDLRDIIKYIAKDSEVQAKIVYHNIKEQAIKLDQLPLRGRIVPELEYFNVLTYRELIAPPWRIIYKVAEDKLWVVAVLDSRRNLEDLLLNRLIRE